MIRSLAAAIWRSDGHGRHDVDVDVDGADVQEATDDEVRQAIEGET